LRLSALVCWRVETPQQLMSMAERKRIFIIEFPSLEKAVRIFEG
jgi:hypothetical protein